MARDSQVLICGASIAGPTLAYWLRRSGYAPTVVERTPTLRAGLGGHAVDLFGPAVDVVEWMGVLPAALAARTRTEMISFERPGKAAITVSMNRLVAGISDRHVEIMRGELASILHEATRHDVEYLFGNSIRTLDQNATEVRVTFAHGPPRRFDLVIGADGLHSVVRRLTFGEETTFRRWLGGYFAVFTVANYLGLDGRMVSYTVPGRVAAMYPVHQTGEARAGFLFRRSREVDYDYHDVEAQKRLLRSAYAGDGWELPRLLAELDRATDFYFDSISQIVMDTWWRGRVSLVGDAGYCPGPAVGGGTSIAVVGAYVLAAALRDAGGDHAGALRNYEAEMGELVRRSRGIGPATLRTLVPRTAGQVWLSAQMMRLVPRLPARLQRRLYALQGGPSRALGSISLKRHQ
jgi:2-polyprenyl-6-methoxyphenol hydroxylase-like FAD-dependent oxidoreductase